MLDLSAVDTLREVAEQGSLSAAARTLHYTQPAISRRIAQLEREVGQPLLIRSRRGVYLTTAGELVVAHGEALRLRLLRMEIELASELPPVTADGIDIRPAREGDERIAHDIHQQSFRDSWEHTAEPYDEWEHWLVKPESFDRGLWFVAWDGDRAAGAALCRVRDGVGWIGILGVLREWRRRGIGRALLLHAFDEFKRRGLSRAGLGVDAESLTGANRLYESAGMHVVRTLDFFEKQLA